MGTDGFVGVTTIEVSAGGATVSVVDPTIAPDVALILVLPWASVLAKPALLMVAIVGCEEFHVAVLVKFCWLPSV